MRVIAIYNIKGGVGKTATAVNMAYLSARAGAQTLLWDLDPQGAATFYFRVKPKLRGGIKKLIKGRRPIQRSIRETDFDALDLLPADFSNRHFDLALEATGKSNKRLAKLLRPLARTYDHIYLDCAPSISVVSEGVFAAADALLVPTIPTTLSLRTLDQLTRHLDHEPPPRPRVLPFFCMVDRRKALHRSVLANGSADHEFLEARIPYASVVEQMGEHRAPLASYAPTAEATRAYEALWHETHARAGS